MKHFIKQLASSDALSQAELSQSITETAFATSKLLENIGSVLARNYSYSNSYVMSYPQVVDVAEGDVIPETTAQVYSLTQSSFSKIASKIIQTKEVVTFPKFDILASTGSLLGKVFADKLSRLVVADINSRLVEIPDASNEQILKVKSGIASSFGATPADVISLIANALRSVPDAYDENTKLFLNKDVYLDFVQMVTPEGLHLVKNNMLLDKYELVIVPQLDADTLYIGSLSDAFDLVRLPSNTVSDEFTIPDCLVLTDSVHTANVCKDSLALVGITAEV